MHASRVKAFDISKCCNERIDNALLPQCYICVYNAHCTLNRFATFYSNHECRCGFALHTLTIQFFILQMQWLPFVCFHSAYNTFFSYLSPFLHFFRFRIFHLFSNTSLETTNVISFFKYSFVEYTRHDISLNATHIQYF